MRYRLRWRPQTQRHVVIQAGSEDFDGIVGRGQSHGRSHSGNEVGDGQSLMSEPIVERGVSSTRRRLGDHGHRSGSGRSSPRGPSDPYRASIGFSPWRRCAAWRKGLERQFGRGLPLRDCHRNCPYGPPQQRCGGQYSIMHRWFSKSGQQGAPERREAASHVIGGDKTIGWLSRCTQVAISK